MAGITRRKVFGLAAAGISLPFCQATAATRPDSVNLGFIAGSPRAWVLGKTDGSYEKAFGLPVKWVSFPSGAMALTLLAAGQIDIAVFGSSPIAAGISRKLPIQIIGAPELIATNERLIVRSAISQINQLEGKTVAYPPSSTCQYTLEAAFKVHHVDSTKVRHLALTQTDTVAAWRRGDIDAAYIPGPFWGQLLHDGGRQLLTSADLQRDGYYVWNSAVVRSEFAERYPDLVVAFLRTAQASVDRYKADPAGASKALALNLGAPPEVTQEVLAGLTYPSLAEQISPRYWGTGPDTPTAPLVKALNDTARFLVDIGELKKVDVPASYASFVRVDLLVRANEKA